MKERTRRAASDRLDDMMGAAARQCVQPDEPYLARVFARAEGTEEESEDARAELDAHLDACASCRAVLTAHVASQGEPVPEWVTDPSKRELAFGTDTTRPTQIFRGRGWPFKKLAAITAPLPLLALAAIVLLSAAPAAPEFGRFEGEIAPTMGAQAPAPPAQLDKAPRYAITGVMDVSVRRADETAEGERVEAFTVGPEGRLSPVEPRFVQRHDDWIGVRVRAPISSLFPDASPPSVLVVCTSRVPAAELAGQTMAEVNTGRDARCVARAIEVVR